MSISEAYNYYNVNLADPRTNSWPLIGNPTHICLILFAYAYFVLKYGRQYMEHRKPYCLKTFIFYYNIFQIVSNTIIVYMFYTAGWATEFTLGCEPVRNTTRPIDMRNFCAKFEGIWMIIARDIDIYVFFLETMLYVTYFTLMLKTIDLVETVIFVLRKKYNQVTFLHVYHHISTVLVTYICTKYFPGGMLSMQMIVNGSVHVIMYTYYLLASLGISWQKVLSPVKPYITRIQIIQFFFLVWHQAQAFSSSCPIPKLAPTMIVGNLLLNLALFVNFYRQSYQRRAKSD